jgi:hypothetical protein
VTSVAAATPVRLQGQLDLPLNRWLWLVKWLLVIPHLILLSFLWIAFGVLTFIAFFAILFTGRYPRVLFDFNVGVLRWSWRVAYYAYGALGTDRYPPFSLHDEPDYPATLDIGYPDRLSHGLVLVKWLLALPQLVLVAIFVGGGSYLASRAGQWLFSFGGGLVGLLVCFAGVALLFTGRYPRGLFDFILGLDRWVLRVSAYVGLMTDSYPPFRLDVGGSDPAIAVIGSDTAVIGSDTAVIGSDTAVIGSDTAVIGSDTALTPPVPFVGPPPAAPEGWPPPPPPARAPSGSGWGAGSVIAVVLGSLLALGGLGSVAGGAAVLVVNSHARNADGMLSTPTETFSSDGYALQFGTADIGWVNGSGTAGGNWLGEVQIRAKSTSTDVQVFVGIGREPAVSQYLSGVRSDRVTSIRAFPFSASYQQQGSAQPSVLPGTQDFWVASVSGVGQQTVSWNAEPGRWVLVVMNADGSAPVTADISLAATIPALAPVGWVLIGVGIGLVALGTVLIVVGIVSARSRAKAYRDADFGSV